MILRAQSLQSCPTLCNPVDCSPPGSSIHRILQARILEGVAMPSSRGIFPTQESESCLFQLQHCQTGSLPLHLGNSQHDIRSYGFAHFPCIISLFHEVVYSKYFKYYSLRNPYRPSDFKWSYKTKQLFWYQFLYYSYNSGDRILMP